MKNINSFLKDNIANISPKNITIAPTIPEKKLNNAIKSFGYDKGVNNIVALYESTLFGSEILFTGEQLIYKASLSKPLHIYYSDIESVNHIKISEKEEFIIINLNAPVRMARAAVALHEYLLLPPPKVTLGLTVCAAQPVKRAS